MELSEAISTEIFISIFVFVFLICPICTVINQYNKKFTFGLTGIYLCLLLLGNITFGGEVTIVIQIVSLVTLMVPISVISSKKTINKESNYVPNNFFKETNNYIEELVKLEICKNPIGKKESILPIEKRRTIAYIFLYIFVFITMLFYFFHIGIFKIIIFVVIGLILYSLIKNISINNYVIKQAQARPDEKISNIITNVLQQKTRKKVLLPYVLIPIVVTCIIFFEPHVFYESVEDGYRIRFYTIGVINPEEIEIPEEYNGKPITSIRGNVFANISSVKEIKLPDTITKINGGAFENTYSLETVRLPKNLEYLGGGAFRNSGVKEIKLPDTLKEMGGEVFKNCYNLKKVELSSGLKEIRGNSFENATSLEEIYIPEGIVNIKSHAFYGCENLKKVRFPSTLEEIGSSAFRNCEKLSCVYIVDNCYINQKAFKNSPTYKMRYDKSKQDIIDIYYKEGACYQ